MIPGSRQRARAGQREGRHALSPRRGSVGRRAVWGLRFGLPLMILLIEALLLNRPGHATLVVRQAPEGQISLPALQVCTSLVTQALRHDLDEMARGTAAGAGSAAAVYRYPATSTMGRRIALAQTRVMETAANDFFSVFGRDADREVRAYEQRLAGACAAP